MPNTIDLALLTRINACQPWRDKWEQAFGSGPVPIDRPEHWAAIGKAGFWQVLSWLYTSTENPVHIPNLNRMHLDRIDMTGADLKYATMTNAYLESTCLRLASLDGANLS